VGGSSLIPLKGDAAREDSKDESFIDISIAIDKVEINYIE